MLAWPVRTFVSMALIGLFASTPAQRGSFGVKPEPFAASVAWTLRIAAVSGMFAAADLSDGIQPLSMSIFWPLSLVSCLIQSSAWAWFLLLAAMPRTEPPR